MQRNALNFITLSAAVALILPSSFAWSWSSDTLEEIPIQKAFVPIKGFDSNDNVEVVLQGELPNPCFSLEQARAEVTGNTIRVKQHAWVSHEGICGTGDLIEMPVPFTTHVGVGRLNVNQYKVVYEAPNQTKVERPFGVELAHSMSVDDYPYAAVSSISVTDSIDASSDVVVELNGVLTSTCGTLKDQVDVKILGDVIIMLPIQMQRLGVDCTKARIPFKKLVNLGKLPPNMYLVHVRSMNGQAIYKAFDVFRTESK